MSGLRGRTIVACLALAFSLTAAQAQTYHREEIRIPMAGAGSGLETLLVRPDAPGRYPLVIISHGSPRKAEDKKHMSPWVFYPAAVEFARRGFIAAIVMRRSYGGSGGQDAERNASCSDPDYVTSGRNGAQDIKAAIQELSRRPDTDGSRIIAVGQSAGGLATVALTAEPPPGLIAAISFAGGRGSKADFDFCNEERLVSSFRTFGKTSRLPMLWVYSENDRYFAPALAEKFRSAFAESGGNAEFIRAPAFGKDGHNLFSLNGIALWPAYVDGFLAKNRLAVLASPMALPAVAALMPPQQLAANGRNAFGLYLRGGQHKAFAVASDGHFGWQTGRRTVEDAKAGAMKFCNDGGGGCKVLFVDDAAAP